MLVSIIIPTFNRSGLVLNAIESALEQTYPDREIIVVDDGSTDDTAERLAPYRDRVRYFYQENKGASAAQNKGIEVARGEWVSILASDDLWLPTKLEAQFHALAQLGEHYGACFTDCIFTGDPAITRSAFWWAGLDCPSDFGPLEDSVGYILAKYPALFVQSMLVRRALLEKVNRFDEELVVGEDTDLLFRLAFHTRFCVVRAPLVKIDRTPSRDRLMDVIAAARQPAFTSIERRYLKWLSLPEVKDGEVRRKLQRNLRVLYYNWAIANFYRGKFGRTLYSIRQIRKIGHSPLQIIATFFIRAIRRSLSLVLRRKNVPPPAPTPPGARTDVVNNGA